MSNVTIRYFVAEGARAIAVAQEGQRRANAYRIAGIALARRYGFDGTITRGSRPYAMVLRTAAPDAERPGFLLHDRHADEDGPMLVFRPNRRTSIGKAADIAMQVMHAFNFSEFACDTFGVTWMSIDAVGHSMYQSVAGYLHGHLVFKIPFGGAASNGGVSGPPIPPDLREIKHSEFIAITEEGGA